MAPSEGEGASAGGDRVAFLLHGRGEAVAGTLQRDAQACAAGGWDPTVSQGLAEVVGGEVVLGIAAAAHDLHAAEGLIAFGGDLARHGDQVQNGLARGGNGGKQQGSGQACAKWHAPTVHGGVVANGV